MFSASFRWISDANPGTVTCKTEQFLYSISLLSPSNEAELLKDLPNITNRFRRACSPFQLALNFSLLSPPLLTSSISLGLGTKGV